MCEKCDEIDRKIVRYQQLASQIFDRQTQDGVAELIKKMSAEKANFGCNQPKE